MKTSLIIKRSISFGALLFFGFIIGYSFAGSCLKMPTLEGVRKDAATKAIQQERKKMKAIEKSYQQKIDSLNAHEQQLSGQLLDIKSRMKAAASKAQHLQHKVWVLSTERKNSTDSIKTTDSAESNTDPLQAGLIELAAAQQQKDSLCNEAITNLETQVSNRDTLINQQQNRYQEIKASLDKSLVQQEGLALENKNIRKQIKKEKRRRTVRTIAATAAVITAGLLLSK